MAGFRLPAASIALASILPAAVRTAPRIGHASRPALSRASCFWATGGSQHSRALLRTAGLKQYQLQRSSLFSTAGSRQAQQTEGSSVEKKVAETTPLSTPAKIATTLKSTLKLDKAKHEQIYNIPNLLTFTRLLATPAIGYLIIHNHHLYAFTLFTYAAFSDLLDGWIARRWNLQTVVGSVVDPMADKLLMTTLVTCLAINGSMAPPLAVLILGRDVSLAVSALYYRYASLPAPKTMARYWDFSLPSAEVHPTNISKFNTFLQLSLLGTLLCTNLLHDAAATQSAAGGVLLGLQDALGGEAGVRSLVTAMSAVVASTTLYSGLEYTWSKKAVKILGGDEALKKKQGFTGRMIMAGAYGSFIAVAVALWVNARAKEEEEGKEAVEKVE